MTSTAALIHRDQVINEAMRRVQHKPWFRGVCTDKARDCTAANFEKAVQDVIDDTAYWDADKGPAK